VKGLIAVSGVHLASRAAEPLAEQLVGYVILFGALMLILRLQYDRPFWQSLAWRPMRMPFGLIVASGLLTAFAVALLGTLIQTPNTENTITELMRDRTSLVLVMIFGTTFGPICEELAFRGFLQPVLVRSMGPVAGITMAAIPFGVLHYQEYGNSWRHVVILSASGAAFGWMRYKTGSTKAAALMHASFNALAFAAVIAQRTMG
jgi:membrane protease YdiL (CAAX protease family)